MIEPVFEESVPSSSQIGELFSLLLRLHPIESGHVSLSAGYQIQAAFLDIVRQRDPELAEQLHTPNRSHPYTLSLLQGFHHLSAEELEVAMHTNRPVEVKPGQTYWLRITILDVAIFGAFVHHLIANPKTLMVRIGEVRFEISRLFTSPDPHHASSTWVGYTSFAALHAQDQVWKQYQFAFASPTAFSKRQPWGKQFLLFPNPADVFESLAWQWERYAPDHLRLAHLNQTPQAMRAWCEEHMVITKYTLTTRYLPSNKFGQTGFLGEVTYEGKGMLTAPEARWLTPFAQFALYSGVGCKTGMGMGQVRCISPQMKRTCEVKEEITA